VNVNVNDTVTADQILMTLDSETAPSDVIAATETLVSAKQALEDAKQSNTSTASASSALASAQSAYNSALGTYWELTDGSTQGSTETIAIYEAKYQMAVNKVDDLQDALDKMAELADDDDKKLQTIANLNQAIIDRDQVKGTLDYYKSTPDALDIQTAKAALDVAKANLEDAQRAYDRVKDGPSADTIAAAQAKVDAAQATVNQLYIIAPFEGEVVAVLTQEGDQVDQGTNAIIIVNRSTLYVDVSIDETDISRVELGDTASITFDALPDVTATGTVTFINPVGSSSQGVVNYTVRVTLDESNPDILLGATATIEINTGEAESLLTVPVSAVLTDESGQEYVIRVNSDGSTEQVSVTSGTVVGTTVVVKGDLSEGEIVQLNGDTTDTTSSTEEAGGMMMGGDSSGFTGGQMPSGGMPSGGAPGQ
jgi:HlyD family secretion protein